MIEPFAREALRGKTILVTGASSGIGRATAVLASRCGAKVILLGRSTAQLEETLTSLGKGEHSSHALQLSESEEAVTKLQNICSASGPLDGVFHSAGVGLVRPIKITKQEHIAEVMAASLGGTFALARVMSMRNIMSQDGGSIVVMSSVAGSRGQAGMSAYSASKGAIDAAVRSLSCELAPRRIRINSLITGAVATEMHQRTIAAMPSDSVDEYKAKHLLGFGEPDDVAHVAVFLLTDGARWVTGASWVVDGGYLAK